MKKLNKQDKEIISFLVAIAMFSGAIGLGPSVERYVRSKTTELPDQNISLVNEDGSPLRTLVLVDNNGRVVEEEKYGYLTEKKENVIFHDILYNNDIELYSGILSSYKAYVSSDIDYLNHYIDSINNTEISLNELKELEDQTFAAKVHNEPKLYYSNLLNDYNLVEVDSPKKLIKQIK